VSDLEIHPYVFEPGTGHRTLLLLHGTGGDEFDPLPLGRKLLPGAALLSPRGNVLEQGMPRFFRRYAEGVFDLEDVSFRAKELARWLRAATAHHGIDMAQTTAVGYSNGANTAAAMMLQEPGLLKSAILLRAMVTIQPRIDHLGSAQVLMLTGEHDPIIPVENARRLGTLLREHGMQVEQHILPTGHQLVPQDLGLSIQWLNTQHM